MRMATHPLRATIPEMADESPPRTPHEELLALPEHVVGEIIRGQLVTHPRPAAPHANVASNLGGELHGPFRRGRGGPGGWIVLDEPELHLHGDILVPDLAGWRRERMPQLPDASAFELAPDWVCEVLSPSTAAVDRADKLPIYARERVKHAWLLDPAATTLEILRLEHDAWRMVGTWRGEAVVRAEPFDAIELELAVLWAR
jgi:Uma2 family endonuclease